jgi:hypothetical protein
MAKQTNEQVSIWNLLTNDIGANELWDNMVGANEVATSITDGLLSLVPQGLNTITGLPFAGVDDTIKSNEKIANYFTRQPETERGQEQMQSIANNSMVQKAGELDQGARNWVGERATDGLLTQYLPDSVKAGLYAAGTIVPEIVGGGLFARSARGLLGGDGIGNANVRTGNQAGATSWHGSPHQWDDVDLEKAGTGEGAQAFGYGFYSAESKGVAEGYAAATPHAELRRKFLSELPEDAEFEDVTSLLGKGHFSKGQEDVIRALESDDWLGFDYPSQAISAAYKDLDNYDPSPSLKDAVNKSGNIYQLDINDKSIATMLDWDSDISSQPGVKEKIEGLLNIPYKDSSIYKQMKEKGFDSDTLQKYLPAYESRKEGVRAILDGKLDSNKGKDMYHALKSLTGQNDPAVAGLLSDAGVKGVKYLDGNSRGADGGTSNYVNFDAKDVKVVTRNGDPIPREGLLDKKKPVTGGVKANAITAGNYHSVGGGNKMERTPSEITATYKDMDGFEPFKNVNVEDLLGKTIISATGDTSIAGKELTGINGVQFDKPVGLFGGFGNQQFGSGFASDKGRMKVLENRAKSVIDEGGEPVISYTSMTNNSNDFNTFMSDSALQMIHSDNSISKGAKKAFDKEMRASNPSWAGINHPEAMQSLRDETGRMRTEFIRLAGQKKWRNEGFPALADIRKAITESSLLNAEPYTSGHNMSAVTGELDLDPKFAHPTYNTHLKQTEYLGGLPKPLPVRDMFPDYFEDAKRRGIISPIRAFELSKPAQKVTTELVDKWGRMMEPYMSNEMYGKPLPHGGQEGGMGEPLLGAPSRPNIPNYGPTTIGKNKDIDFALDNYAKQVGHPVNKPDKYVPLDKKFAGEAGREFESMGDDMSNPRVQASYKSLVNDIDKQYKEALRAGIKPYFIGKDNPYQSSPSLSLLDMANNRKLGIFPTKDGYGSDKSFDTSNNPMLAESPYDIDGVPMLWNDVFRFVHDAYGHGATGVGFRAAGEDNAYISHFASLSPASRLALANETRGQNSALNYGKNGEHNRTANQDDTVFQDQKAGLLSNKTIYGNVNKAFDEPIVLKGGLLPGDPKIAGAVNDEGLLSMKHYARQELDSIDPARFGEGMSGRTRAEMNRSYHPDFQKRSYYGLETDVDPYKRESGLGSIKHEATIAPEHIYDSELDSEGLFGSGGDVSTKEKAVFDAGYSGYMRNHPQLGKVAVVFDKLEAKRLKESGFALPILLAAQGAGTAAVLYFAGRD